MLNYKLDEDALRTGKVLDECKAELKAQQGDNASCYGGPARRGRTP